MCGNSSAVEHCLAKARVAGSNPVSRSIFSQAASPSGKAKVCKTFIPGSNPGAASICIAWVAEQVDARDLKSLDGNVVPVRFRPQAPIVGQYSEISGGLAYEPTLFILRHRSFVSTRIVLDPVAFN